MIKTQSINFGSKIDKNTEISVRNKTRSLRILLYQQVWARMFSDWIWKSKTRNDVLRASFRSFVYMGDDDDGVWLVC